MIVELYDRQTNKKLKTFRSFTTLKLENAHPGGYSIASIEIPWKLVTAPSWAKRGNGIVVTTHDEVAWAGTPDVPTLKEETISLENLGWSTTLKECGHLTNLPAQAGSAFAQTILSDSRCKLQAGQILTGDYEAPPYEVTPRKTWDEILSFYASLNDSWHYGVWEDKKLDWRSVDLTPTYYVLKKDCESSPEIALESPPYANRLYYTYTFGSLKSTDYVENIPEQQNFGRVVEDYWSAPDGATHNDAIDMATVKLNSLLSNRSRGEIRVTRIFKDRLGSKPYPLALVKSSFAVCMVDRLPIDASLSQSSQVNELNTFTIKNVTYEMQEDKELLTLTPTDSISSLDVLVARASSRSWIG